VATADVPVGGAVVAGRAPVVVSQPTAGDFHAFSSTCTHNGCTVGWNAAEALIACPCHGSRFSPVDGSVVNGPAPVALPAVAITVHDGYVYPA
jgi:Rieske Fe-S protein